MRLRIDQGKGFILIRGEDELVKQFEDPIEEVLMEKLELPEEKGEKE